MGRFTGFIAALVGVARLVVDALLIARDFRDAGAPAEPIGAPDVGGSAEAVPPDGPGALGPGGPPAGAPAGEGQPVIPGGVMGAGAPPP